MTLPPQKWKVDYQQSKMRLLLGSVVDAAVAIENAAAAAVVVEEGVLVGLEARKLCQRCVPKHLLPL